MAQYVKIDRENSLSHNSDSNVKITYSEEKKSDNAGSTNSGNSSSSKSDSMKEITVVVTGASGFVASHIIKELLESPKYKYTVIGTVRNNISNYDWLYNIVDRKKKINGKLQLEQVPSLENESSFEMLYKVIKNANYVLHVASPYIVNTKDVYNDLLKPAVNGTENILNVCRKVSIEQKLQLNEYINSNANKNTLNNNNSNSNNKHRQSGSKYEQYRNSINSNSSSHSHSSNNNNSLRNSNINNMNFSEKDENYSNILKLQRVVITSSMAAITDNPIKKYNEFDWNLMSNELRNAYYWSKTESEKAAWRWMYKNGNINNWDQLKLIEYDIKFEDNGIKIEPCSDKNKVTFDLCVCNPWMVIGRQLNSPHSVDGLNTSNKIFADLINGKYPIKMNLSWAFVDVIDVAHSHVMMIEYPSANGRYILAAETWTFEQISNLLKIICISENAKEKIPSVDCRCQCCGQCCMPCLTIGMQQGTKSYLETNINTYAMFDNTRIRTLGKNEGFQFRPIEFCIQDLVKWQIQMGYIPRK